LNESEHVPVTYLAHHFDAISAKTADPSTQTMTTAATTQTHPNKRPELLKADQDNIRTFSSIGLSALNLSCIWLTDLNTINQILKQP
jgi:hypothetical protein